MALTPYPHHERPIPTGEMAATIVLAVLIPPVGVLLAGGLALVERRAGNRHGARQLLVVTGVALVITVLVMVFILGGKISRPVPTTGPVHVVRTH